jgi:Flp pilus assembly protein TadG
MMKRRGTGQALVEFAMVIPLFLIVVFGVLDLGRGIWAMDTAAHAASEATRFAIVHGGSVNTSCHVGTPAPPPIFISPTAACPNPSPSKQMIYDLATSSALASGGAVTVTACYANPSSLVVANRTCVGDTDSPDGNNTRGMSVTVRVTIHVAIVTGTLLGVNDFNVSSTATMVVNN